MNYNDLARLYGCDTADGLFEVIKDLHNQAYNNDNRVKQLEKELEDTKYKMGAANDALGMKNYQLKIRIKELEKEVLHRKATQEFLNFELSMRMAKIKELEKELEERKQICKDLTSQPRGYLVGDK